MALWERFETKELLAVAALKKVRGPNVALSGGGTYREVFRLWRGLHPNFSEVNFFLVDDRKVPRGDQDSNLKLLDDELLKGLGHKSCLMNWPLGADEYRDLLMESLGGEIVFDQIFLGVGEDGHTASLFEFDENPKGSVNQVLDTKSNSHKHARVSLSYGTILNAKEIIVIAFGEKKKEIIRQGLGGDERWPISVILNSESNVTILSD